jgi:hypothetical protein
MAILYFSVLETVVSPVENTRMTMVNAIAIITNAIIISIKENPL